MISPGRLRCTLDRAIEFASVPVWRDCGGIDAEALATGGMN